MPYTPTTGDRLLAAWLSLTSTLWNKRLVSTLTYNEAHVLGILLRAELQQKRLSDRVYQSPPEIFKKSLT